MNTPHHSHITDSPYSLIEEINRYVDAGIDPAFDTDMEELERQFAEYRLGLAKDVN